MGLVKFVPRKWRDLFWPFNNTANNFDWKHFFSRSEFYEFKCEADFFFTQKNFFAMAPFFLSRKEQRWNLSDSTA